MGGRVTDVLLSLAERLSAAASLGGGGGRSVLRLDELLDARASAEDAGLADVEVYEEQARLLMPLDSARGAEARRRGVRVAGVDSSSRHLETPPADIVIGAVAVSGSWGASYTWPSVSGGGGGPPFIYLLPNSPRASEAAAVEGGLVSQRNPAGAPFDQDYSIHQALDEMRVTLENWALRSLSAGDGFAVLLDGPVFLVARAVFDQVPARYRESWRRMLEERLEALRALEARGIPVVGVVKRVERSRLLSSAAGAARLLARCGLEGGGAGDRALVDAALRAGCFKWRAGSVLRSPKLLVRLGAAGAKIVEYVVVPAGGYQLSPASARIYRLEYTEETLSLLRSVGLEPSHVFLADSVARGSLEPVTVALSDRRASALTRGLRRMLASALRAGGLPLSYSSLVEVESDWRGA
jgi:hypothetical protein